MTLGYKWAITTSLVAAIGCTKVVPPPAAPTDAKAVDLHGMCEPYATPRVETVGNRIFFAIGYDLANTVLIQTDEGNIVIDAGTSPAAASKTREALLAKAPGKTRALIFTHSHIDHVGGASVWAEAGTDIWAAAPFAEQFFKQYGLFQQLEQRRGRRQYGSDVERRLLPCSAIGANPDLSGALQTGARMPTRVVSGRQELTIGGVRLVLIEAHGESRDQLMIWLPDERVVVSGDNIYRAFPNLYTIRGTSPRPVDKWIDSLDEIRRLAPKTLLPGHTEAVHGEEAVQRTVTSYRDGIQWVRDATVRAANSGATTDRLAEWTRLPQHLAASPWLQETYGQTDWSAKGIYTSEIGWFDGSPADLYPVPVDERERREIELMGGAAKVLDEGEKALETGDIRWAVHLLSKVKALGDKAAVAGRANESLARALDALARQTRNSNGRAYLAEYAVELAKGPPDLPQPNPDRPLLESTPLSIFFRRMSVTLDPAESLDIHESLRLEFPDLATSYTVTVRAGIAEIIEGAPLPGTPTPLGVIKVDSMVWKRLALQQISLAEALTSGQLAVEGAWLGTARFLRRFRLE